MRYPGGKNGGGAYQNIINLIPPHETYVEAFAGSAAVWRHLKPPSGSILVEKDCAAAKTLSAMVDQSGRQDTQLYNSCAFDVLPELLYRTDAFIYLDPPYLPETRKRLNLYNCELSFDDHVRLLHMIYDAPARIAISGYASGLYENALFGWNRFQYEAMTRGGTMRTETVWFNYDKPEVLHDYSHLGTASTDRQRIRRKLDRHVAKLANLPVVERNAIIARIQQTFPTVTANTDGSVCDRSQSKVSSPDPRGVGE